MGASYTDGKVVTVVENCVGVLEGVEYASEYVTPSAVS